MLKETTGFKEAHLSHLLLEDTLGKFMTSRFAIFLIFPSLPHLSCATLQECTDINLCTCFFNPCVLPLNCAGVFLAIAADTQWSEEKSFMSIIPFSSVEGIFTTKCGTSAHCKAPSQRAPDCSASSPQKSFYSLNLEIYSQEGLLLLQRVPALWMGFHFYGR